MTRQQIRHVDTSYASRPQSYIVHADTLENGFFFSLPIHRAPKLYISPTRLFVTRKGRNSCSHERREKFLERFAFFPSHHDLDLVIGSARVL